MKPFIASGDVQVTACPHPLTLEQRRLVLPTGGSLLEMVRAAGISGDYAHVSVDGVLVPPERWRRAYPKAGALVTVRAIPAGGEGGGKNTLRIVLQIAVVAVAAWVTGGAGGLLAKGFVSGLAGAAVGIAGNLAINALIPPPKLKGLSQNSLSLDRFRAVTGTRNSDNPYYGPIPRPYGHHRLFPVYAAMPFTEAAAGAQYLRMLFAVGYGPLQITDLKIGDTPIDTYQDVEYEIRQGWDDDPPLVSYADTVFEENLSLPMSQPDGAWTPWYVEWFANGERLDTVGDWVSRTTRPDTRRIAVEVTAPGGLYYFQPTINYKNYTVVFFEVEYAVAGSGLWQSPTSATGRKLEGDVTQFSFISNGAALVITGLDEKAKFASLSWDVPQGQYDVRIRRICTFFNTNPKKLETFDTKLGMDDVYWTALRSIYLETSPIDTAKLKGLAMVALKIKATDQLNGVLDQFNCVVQALLPTYDGAQWTAPVATNNPAWAYADILTGRGNNKARDKSRLIAAEFKAWADWCTANGIEFNAVIDARTTVSEACRDVAAVGFASPAQRDGLYTIVRDIPQNVPVQHFTPRNASGFNGTKVFQAPVHAFRVHYTDPVTWREAQRIVYDDGYNESNATIFETLQAYGCTRADQAWRLGRYHLAVARLRPETYEIRADVEHLVCQRGDLVRVQYDVPLWGLAPGARVKSVTTDGSGQVTAVVLDEEITMEAGKSYACRFRREDGSSALASIITMPGSGTDLSFADPVSGILPGDLAMFGKLNQETVELLVKGIRPGPDLSATLTLVDAAPTIYDAWSGQIPPFDPGMTAPVDLAEVAPRPPLIIHIVSDDTTARRTAGGILHHISVSYHRPSERVPVDVVQAQYQLRGPDGTPGSVWTSAGEFEAAAGSVLIGPFPKGEIYGVRLRFRSIYGRYSLWTETQHTVVGKEILPADPTGFALAVVGSDASLTWDAAVDLDVRDGGYFRVRHTPLTAGYTWNDGTDIGPVVPGNSIGTRLPLLRGTYMLKAVDSLGNHSAGYAAVATDVPDLLPLNVVATLTESPTFTGAKNDVEVVNGGLQMVLNPDGSAKTSGEYLFSAPFDLGAVYTSRLSLSIATSRYEALPLFDDEPGLFDERGAFDGAAVNDNYVTVYVATTEDDPFGSPVWSDWKPFTVGDYRARGYRWKVAFVNPTPAHQIRIEELSVTIDMPDRVEGANDFVVPAAGLTVVFPGGPFKEVPAVAITGQNLQEGDRLILTNKSTASFTMQYVNGGVGVERTADYVAKGYGRSR